MDSRENIMKIEYAIDLYSTYKTKLVASINLHRQHAQHYLAFIAAILVATIAGTIKINELGGYAILLVAGPILNILLCILAVKMCDRFYEGFLEDVTVTAKLEHEIGLSTESNIKDGHVFPQDSIFVPERWLTDMKPYASSTDFINTKMKSGSNRINRITFLLLGITNVLLAIFLYLEIRY